MMKTNTTETKIIIHISDIHMRRNCELSAGHLKRETLLLEIKRIVKSAQVSCLLITGDLADSGEQGDYDEVKSLLNELVSVCKIEKERVIIVPGNHDISRFEYRSTINRKPQATNSELQSAKMFYFKKFYDEFYGETHNSTGDPIHKFNPDCMVFRGIEKFPGCENAYFFCINSNYARSDGNEFIPLGLLDLENEVSRKISDKNYPFLIGITHELGDESGYCNSFWRMLCSNNINSLFFGHIHAGVSNSQNKNGLTMQSQTGMLLQKSNYDKKDYATGFIVYKIYETKTHIDLIRTTYKFTQDSQETKMDKIPDDEPVLFCGSRLQNTAPINESGNLFYNNTKDEFEAPVINDPASPQGASNLGPAITSSSTIAIKQSEIFNTILKENKVYTTGHFHLANNKRTHVFINLMSVLGARKWRKVIADHMSVEANKVLLANQLPSVDLIIGFGMYGTIIGTLLSSLNEFQNAAFTYFPQPNREHNCQELRVSANASSCVLIVTDVVCTGESVIKIIDNNPKLFENSKNIIVASVIHKLQPKFESYTEIYEDYLQRNISKNMPKLNIYYFALGYVNEIPCTHKGDASSCPVFSQSLSKVSIMFAEDDVRQ